MAGYIGNEPLNEATQTRESFTATSGQTSFATSGYTPGYLDVYFNGVHLETTDYTATNGSDVVLDTAAAADDILTIVAWKVFNPTNVSVSDITDLTATAAELNYCDGVTSNIQTQIDNLDAFPDQTGQSGKYLTTNGTNVSWGTVDLSSKLDLSGGTMTGAITFAAGQTFDGRDVSADGSKLDGIEAGADVTDTANVTAAGALMDSEVTNLAQVKAFDSSDYATAAQGALADSAVQPSDNISGLTNDSGYITGNQTITLSGDVSGSGTTSISVTVADDSHNHVISNVDGLQTALDAKVATSGDTMTGDLSFGDNDKAIFGAGSDLQIYHDTSGNSFINESGSGSLFMQGDNIRFRTTDGAGTYALFTNSGAVNLYYNNSEKLSTTSTGIDVTGTVAADGLTLGDNEKAQFGASNDLQISHTGTLSLLNETGTGDFELRTNGGDIRLVGNGGSDFMVRAISNGAVTLYYDNASKLATTSTGVSVTGDVTVSGGDIVLSGTGRIQGIDTVSASTDAASKAYVDANSGGAVANECIYENSQTITSNYTMTTNKNGHSAGPITINTGVTVTIPTGSNWVVS